MNQNYKTCSIFMLMLTAGTACFAATTSVVDKKTVQIIDHNGNIVSDHSKSNAVRSTVEITGAKPVTLNVTTSREDTEGVLIFNVYIINNSKNSWHLLNLYLLGDVEWNSNTDHFNQGVAGANAWNGIPPTAWEKNHYESYERKEPKVIAREITSKSASLKFEPPIPSPGGVLLGNDVQKVGGDWHIKLNNLKPGDSFMIRIEPIIEK